MNRLGQWFANEYRNDTSSWSSQQTVEKVFTRNEEKPVRPIQIGPNSIILGYEFPEFKRDEVRVLDFNLIAENGERNVFTGFFIGNPNSGKTLMAKKVVLDNMVDRWKHKAFIADPQREWDKSKLPYQAANPRAVDRCLAEADQYRHGYDLVTVSPAKLDLGTDYEFKITFKDILELAQYSPDDAVGFGLEILGIDSTMDPKGYSTDLFKSQLKPKVQNWAMFREGIQGQTTTGIDSSGHKVKKMLPGSALLLYKLSTAFSDRIVSNKNEDSLPILELMRDHQVIDYQEKMRRGKKDSYVYTATNAMLKITIQRFINDCEAWNKFKDQNAVIKASDIDMVWDEGDQYADAEGKTTTVDFVTQNMTKDRKTGIHVAFIVQEAAQANRYTLSQCRYKFSSQLTAENASVFKNIKMDQDTIKNLFKLDWIKPTSIGTEVPQWAVYGPDGLTKFRPGPQISDHMKRKVAA